MCKYVHIYRASTCCKLGYMWVKILVLKLFVFRKHLNSQWELNPCLPIVGSVVLPLDYTVSDGNAMSFRDLVPAISFCNGVLCVNMFIYWESTYCKLGYMWVKIVVLKLFLFRKHLNSERESNLCLPIVGSVVLPLDYRVSDGNAMLFRDLVPTTDMCPLCLKAHHIIL